MAIVADSNTFVCTFEDDSCPLFNSPASDENWIRVDGSFSSMTDNTLNHGRRSIVSTFSGGSSF